MNISAPVRTLFISSVLALSACSDGKKGDDRSLKSKAADTVAHMRDFDYRLSGVWNSNCAKVGGIVDLGSTKKVMGFSPTGSFYRNEFFYRGDNCDDRDLAFVYYYKGDLQGLTGTSQDGQVRTVDLQVKHQTVTPKRDNLTEWLNSVSVCGIKDWQTNKERDITGHDCAQWLLGKRETIYDTYRIKHGRLTFGYSSWFNNKSSDDRRPTELDRKLKFTRTANVAKLLER